MPTQISSKQFIPTIDIGTQFIRRRGKNKNVKVETVDDILSTYNNEGELVSVRYVASHLFCGQVVIDRNIVATTILRGIKSD
jgi:hypothetical protein